MDKWHCCSSVCSCFPSLNTQGSTKGAKLVQTRRLFPDGFDHWTPSYYRNRHDQTRDRWMRLVVTSDYSFKYMTFAWEVPTPFAIHSCSTFGHLFKMSGVLQDVSAPETQLKWAAQWHSPDHISKTIFQWRIKTFELDKWWEYSTTEYERHIKVFVFPP